MLETFTVDTFTPYVGETLQLRLAPQETLPVVLTEANLLGNEAIHEAARRRGRRLPFSLLFRGPRTPLLPQRIYHLEHTALGAFDLFLVPLGPDGTGLIYEAVFT